MAARLAVERRRGGATGNIVTEALLPERAMNEGVAALIRDSRDFLSRLR
jgi:hypothetical protein